jgi:hypothetical protein
MKKWIQFKSRKMMLREKRRSEQIAIQIAIDEDLFLESYDAE